MAGIYSYPKKEKPSITIQKVSQSNLKEKGYTSLYFFSIIIIYLLGGNFIDPTFSR